MSIPVPLDDLGAALARYPWGYLVTVADDLRARFLAAPTRFVDGALVIDAGRTGRANAAARPQVTMVFPSPEPHEFSLIVDGDAVVDESVVRVWPTWAVLHRPAIAAPDGPSDGEPSAMPG